MKARHDQLVQIGIFTKKFKSSIFSYIFTEQFVYLGANLIRSLNKHYLKLKTTNLNLPIKCSLQNSTTTSRFCSCSQCKRSLWRPDQLEAPRCLTFLKRKKTSWSSALSMTRCLTRQSVHTGIGAHGSTVAYSKRENFFASFDSFVRHKLKSAMKLIQCMKTALGCHDAATVEVRCRQQPNAFDFGIWVCANADSIAGRLAAQYTNADIPMLPEITTIRKRAEIRDLVLEMSRAQNLRSKMSGEPASI